MLVRARMLLPVLLIIAALLTGCSYVLVDENGQVKGQASEIEVATAVAQTMEAMGVDAPEPASEEQHAAPDDAAQTATPEPIPTPEALQVVYTATDGNLYRWTEAGGSHPITTGGEVESARISPDGTLVTFLRTSDYVGYSLWVVGSNGQGERMLVSAEELAALRTNEDAVGASPYQYEWAPDSHTIVFNTRLHFEGPGLLLQDDLRKVDADSGEMEEFLPAGEGGMFYYSPDGSQIALVTPEKVSLINSDGSQRRDGVLTYDAVLTFSEYQYYVEPRWNADSSYLRVVVPPRDPMTKPVPPTSVWEIPTDGSEAVKLSNYYPSMVGLGRLSPDLEHVSYLQEPDSAPGAGFFRLMIARVDGSEYMIYHAVVVGYSSWSPDSQHFLFNLDDQQNYQLGNIDGDFRQLTEYDRITDVQWVDDENFLFLHPLSGGAELRLGDLDGSGKLVASLSGDPVTVRVFATFWMP
jgi:Tol biopolymer transport system component